MTLTPLDARNEVVRFLRRHLTGPAFSEDEILDNGNQPQNRYTVGVLFPRGAQSTGSVNEIVEDGATSGPEELADDPVSTALQDKPASVALSFLLSENDDIHTEVWAAVYEPLPGGATWRRRVLATEENPDRLTLSAASPRCAVFGGRAELWSRWRTLGSGWLVTVALVNSTTRRGSWPSPEECLFQTGLRCSPRRTGAISPYPEPRLLGADDEEIELALRFRNVHVFAIGHGCAAGWSSSGAEASSVWVDWVPAVAVPDLGVRVSSEGDRVLEVDTLSSLGDDALVEGLRGFVDEYASWIAGLAPPPASFGVPANRVEAAYERIIGRLNEAVERMTSGIRLLERDPLALEAFRLANRAMAMQIVHQAPDLAGTRHARRRSLQLPGEYATGRSWYPFQLAFFLLVAESVAEPESDHRPTVDLLWFPTGGGKTEAYLLVSAFAILLRRLRDPSSRSAGTTVITRYTLRLLTTQQFQRTATLVCALELLRQGNPERLGREQIDIGIWVGRRDTPNRFTGTERHPGAFQLAERTLTAAVPRNRFLLERCPWCGTSVLPPRRSDDKADYGFVASPTSFEFRCPSDDCPFNSAMPVQVVDEALYDRPPTVIIGTVDKFANLAWLPRSRALFGGGGVHRPPSLVIQDELHLLAGPLGSTVGLYEAAISSLCEDTASPAKVIASTATIRAAPRQVQALFGLPTAIFPPSGLDADDSYFARVDPGDPGRLYVGVMAPAHSPVMSFNRVCGFLLQAPIELGLSGVSLDAYSTLVAYHNSLRELGHTVTSTRDDIREYSKLVARAKDDVRRLDDGNVVELRSGLTSDELPRRLERLGVPEGSTDHVAIAVCTNMISVGVDVKRLGLMVVNGQPKTTSEYIQATSRVGRTRAAPGLVVAHFSAGKPRDRSHYEHFRGFHGSLYRHVEPTSVTPLSLRCRERNLPAALVIVVRHLAGLNGNESAGEFRGDDENILQALARLTDAFRRSEPDEARAAEMHIQRLVSQWESLAENRREPLVYDGSRPHRPLLVRFGSSIAEAWVMPTSMRSVDLTCDIWIQGARHA